jgi:hypothetical protein
LEVLFLRDPNWLDDDLAGYFIVPDNTKCISVSEILESLNTQELIHGGKWTTVDEVNVTIHEVPAQALQVPTAVV